MYQYLMSKIINERKQYRDDILAKTNQSIDGLIAKSYQKDPSNFADVYEYLKCTFPSIKIDDIPVYLCGYDALSQTEWKTAYGFFVPHRKIIFLLNLKTKPSLTSKSVFYKRLYQLLDCNITEDEILVHELMHAVSFLTTRSQRSYAHQEEEFAYTNSVPYYLKKGMSEDEIIEKHFLIFCCNDLFQNVDHMTQLLKQSESIDMNKFYQIVNLLHIDSKTALTQYEQFLDANVNYILPIIINKAREKAKHMISSYNKYGISTVYSSKPTTLKYDLDVAEDF